ncbi:MAG: hypothetical protein QM719_02670 [Thermomonas sp.]
MIKVLLIIFMVSGFALLPLRLLLVSDLKRDRSLYSKLGEPNPVRLGDALAVKVLQYFKRFSPRLRIVLVAHLIAWAISWTLPFVILGHEIWVR